MDGKNKWHLKKCSDKTSFGYLILKAALYLWWAFGLLRGPRSHLKLAVFVVILTVAFTTFTISTVDSLKKSAQLRLIEDMHWCLVSLLCITCSAHISNLWTNEALAEAVTIINSKFGLVDTPYPADRSDLEAVEEGQESQIRRVVKWVVFAQTSYLATFLVQTILIADGSSLFLPLWLFFKIDSKLMYSVVVCIQLVVYMVIALYGWSIVLMYVAMLAQLCSQLQLLRTAIRRISERTLPSHPHSFHQHFKMCIRHHVIILRFFKALSGLFGGILAIFNVSIIVMLTTLGFIITDPKRTSQDLATLGVLLVEELIAAFGFCWFGQKVHDEGCALTSALYTDVDWHLLPYTSRKTLLLMVIRSQRPMIIKGWTRDYTLSGLSDILQGAYSFFNMLVAFRSGNK